MSEELEIDELITKIFKDSPKPQHSIQLSFISDIDIKNLFEFLLTFITNGSKIIFGGNTGTVNISKWTDIEFNILNNYCKSIGFEFILDRFSTEEEELINFKNMSYKKKEINNYTKLETLKLPIKCNDDIFVFSFKFL
tara:strand:+ start:254 stop:667 length:414 start_codon:yes stop_codon:yes gene_type:complete